MAKGKTLSETSNAEIPITSSVMLWHRLVVSTNFIERLCARNSAVGGCILWVVSMTDATMWKDVGYNGSRDDVSTVLDRWIRLGIWKLLVDSRYDSICMQCHGYLVAHIHVLLFFSTLCMLHVPC